MAKVSENSVYCSRHGWSYVEDRAEVVPGVFVPICGLCAEAK